MNFDYIAIPIGIVISFVIIVKLIWCVNNLNYDAAIHANPIIIEIIPSFTFTEANTDIINEDTMNRNVNPNIPTATIV